MGELRISYNAIWALPFFSDMKDPEKSELLKVAKLRPIQRGETLFLQGDPLTQFYWVCDGAMQMFRATPDGREITGSIRIPGEILFDPDALQLKKNHTTNARAAKETTLLEVPSVWMEEHIKTDDNLAGKFINILAKSAQEALIETEHQATMNAAQIVACFLQRMCTMLHLDPNGFDLPYTKSLLASRLGMELESFSRTLPKLRDHGIVVEGKHVSFSNIDAAQSYSCGACSAIDECPANKIMQKFSKNKVLTPYMQYS